MVTTVLFGVFFLLHSFLFYFLFIICLFLLYTLIKASQHYWHKFLVDIMDVRSCGRSRSPDQKQGKMNDNVLPTFILRL